MFRLHKLLAALCLLLSLSGCGGSGDSSLVLAERALQTRVTATSQSGNSGTMILTVTIANPGRSSFTLGSANAAIYDVEVDDAGGERVWDYGLVNIPQPTQITLAPGQVQTFTITWYPLDRQGVSLMPGAYLVKAALIPQTINGAAVSIQQQNAMPAATAPVTITTIYGLKDRMVIQQGVVIFGLNADQDTPENKALLMTAGIITQYYPQVHDGSIALRPGVSVEAGIAFLQTYSFVRFAEPNGYVYLSSRAVLPLRFSENNISNIFHRRPG